MYLTLTSSSGSKFYDHVPGLEWEAKSVHNDVPAFTRVRVTDGSLRATTYEVPTGTDGQVTAQAAASSFSTFSQSGMVHTSLAWADMLNGSPRSIAA